ncbi:phage baseplate assembly protein V [Chitinibacter sp. S2-10]|uniref:phage baseplate assembly protein V n=1 Tax=Chitinibacter sp. S2-10 TaxID=3373597 RepID=UPI003977C929
MWREVDARIQRALSGVRRAFRGAVILLKNGGPVVRVQGEGLAGEQIQGAELFQHYGLTTMPPAGSMMIVLPVGGKTSHGIVIATEHGSYRLKTLEPGEVALYDDQGQSVILRRGKIMEMNTDQLVINAATKVQINTPTISTTAAIEAEKDITDKVGSGGKSMANMRASYNDHDHHENGVGGNTGKTNQQV